MFEILEKDLAGRIGILETRHGKIETPAIAPVVNPSKNIIIPAKIVDLNFPLLMTNAYILKKQYGELAEELSVHRILGVEKPVMTDSGAYQLMTYGKIDVTPEEILRFEEAIGSDIGVILDLPTPPGLSQEEAKERVEETLRRAKKALEIRKGEMLLVGPVQGSIYLDLVEYSAREMSDMNFDIFAIGGFTQLMERYNFVAMADAVVRAKTWLPPDKPVHLFGGGNPVMLSLAVALGIDLFDSAAYAIYAKDLRYMTGYGVLRFERLKELPCNCPICSKYKIEDLKELPREELEQKIALHNLYVISKEIKTIKQAIHEGWLWELIERKAAGQPAIMDALCRLRKYVKFLEKHHPVTRQPVRGLTFSLPTSIWRPEIYRHVRRLDSRYLPPTCNTLLILPETPEKPYTRYGPISIIYKLIKNKGISCHIIVYSPIFGIVPIELSEIFPLSQYKVSRLITRSISKILRYALSSYLIKHSNNYTKIIFIIDDELINVKKSFIKKLKSKCPSIKTIYYSVSRIKDEKSASQFLHKILNID